MKLPIPFPTLLPSFRSCSICAVAAAALVVSSAVRADYIPGAITTATATAGGNSDGVGFINEVVNGAGLIVGDPLNAATWLHNNDWQDGWQQNFPGTLSTNQNWFTINLGGLHNDLNQMVIWNTREVFDRGSQNVNIYYAASTPTSGITNDTASDFLPIEGWTLLGNYNIAQAGPVQTFNSMIDVSGISAQYIAIEILTNYGSTFRTGFSEIQVTVVPEPSTLALLGLATAGGACFVARRRRRKA